MKNIKYPIYVLLIVVGILFFKGGNALLNNMIRDKESSINIKNVWDEPIYIKSEGDIDITPSYLFNSIPPMKEYPLDKLVYFKHINTRTSGSKSVVTAVIIQNNEILFKNQYYFDISNSLILNKIVNEDLVSGEVHTIDSGEEMKELIMVYKDFIELYISR